jgi:hypothetical protein
LKKDFLQEHEREKELFLAGLEMKQGDKLFFLYTVVDLKKSIALKGLSQRLHYSASQSSPL